MLVWPSYDKVNLDWEYTALLKTFGATKSSSYRVTTKDEADALLASETFGATNEIQLVDVVMPVMDAPRALQEQARLLSIASRRSEEDVEQPLSKKRKVNNVATETANGIGFHGLTNGAQTLS